MLDRMMVLVMLALAAPAAAQTRTPTPIEALGPRIEALFSDYAREQHIPGLVYGVVKDGRLVLVKGVGVQDVEAKRPVTADTRFRIASMSKAFTALAILDLRDQGKLRLDDPAERYVPQLRGWTYPTKDSPRIRIRDLLTHSAGFVDDNPWGDRQTPLPEPDFTRMLAAGVPFARVPQSAMEYSNFGYAVLGRIVTNVSGKPFEDYVAQRFFKPLGMARTGYDVFASPQTERALGYRWEDGAWTREPDMARGAFGAMGGVETTADDYARYVAWLLSAWPARDDPERGPLTRASMREIEQGSNFATLGDRRAGLGEGACKQATAYGFAWRVIQDCDFRYLTHTGGYPGYGSVVILLPQAGVGIFAFANRTYAAPVPPAYRALTLMKEAGLTAPPPLPVTDRLAAGYAAVRTIWNAGEVTAAKDALAMNFLMDRSAGAWKAELARLKAEARACDTSAPITATTWMAGRFSWSCGERTLTGTILLAPTATAKLQELRLKVAPR